ncbi:YeeE/YedE family protein [Rhodovulum sulfidophilum]|uniref:YeeE/YedE family protein n=1 Tax=Rhodovulum sulfidophilum TaxID=35806 RepID=UPI00192081DB|nr:YeeE/YedE family protein [Rhodovulum sulfidophilum]MBL3572711.1 YeeE/YedE family protein [Rhodovulum sulfidophilum]MCE8430536.1 YeeE/YedE family protein [Rhodovulum sulfidophilum]MCF4117179.1 YeeE/YedE family protein [Rhodovulum sulfidophilum]
METIPPGAIAALIGLATGCVLGLAARLGDFCTLGALETAIWGADQRRIRMWGVSLGVAIAATALLTAVGQIDTGATIYHQIRWNPAASVLGGLAFGYGMALAGNCGFGALARFGGGDLRSLVIVVVISIFGFVTLSGPLAPLRDLAFPQQPSDGPQSLALTGAALTGLPPLALALGLAALAAGWGLWHRPLRAEPHRIGWAVAAGLAVSAALWGTSALHEATLGAVDVEGHTFTAPLGRTLMWMMTSSAGGLSFSVGSVLGVLAGAWLGSWRRRSFRWEACEDPRELGRQVAGAALMGIGGVVALGCTIGQGLTAFATLAWSAPVTLAAIAAGAVFGLRRLIAGFQPD